MAYNSSKGPQTHGDVKYEGDAEDTQIDFENDFIALKTNGVQRFIVNSNAITSSVALSCSLAITASHFVGDGSALSGVGSMSSFTLAGDGGSSQTMENGNTLTIAGGTGLTTTAGATDTVTIDLDNTAVSAGSYTYSAITVDAQGRLTAASNGTGPAITSYTNASDNRIVTSVNSNTLNAEANLTFDGTTLTLNGTGIFSGPLSASAGMHISGTMPKLAIGSNSPAATNEGMLTIRPDDTNNRVLMMVQRTEASDNRVILAATGSGQVIVGGAHLDAVFNVSGSDIEKLISLKSDSINPVFEVSGSGKTTINGTINVIKNSTDVTPQLHIHENDTEYGRISFTNNADTSGSITGFSHEWTLAGSSSAQGSQTDARFNIWYGDAQGNGNGLDLLEMNGIGDTTIKGTLALNCYQEDGTTTKSDPATLVGHAHIYSKLVTGHAEMFVRDSNGNVTQISPHNPEGEWQYFSRNTRTGKVVRVNMEKMIKKLEQITGESFMEEWYEDPTD